MKCSVGLDVKASFCYWSRWNIIWSEIWYAVWKEGEPCTDFCFVFFCIMKLSNSMPQSSYLCISDTRWGICCLSLKALSKDSLQANTWISEEFTISCSLYSFESPGFFLSFCLWYERTLNVCSVVENGLFKFRFCIIKNFYSCCPIEEFKFVLSFGQTS